MKWRTSPTVLTVNLELVQLYSVKMEQLLQVYIHIKFVVKDGF